MNDPELLELEPALAALNAAAEETRLRLLLLLAESELTVSEIVAILGQSQPRVSRHLKLLVEAGFLERHREGAWAFFRLAQAGPAGELGEEAPASARSRWTRCSPRTASGSPRPARRAPKSAERYFAAHAGEWDDIRSLHVSEARVEAAIMETVGEGRIRSLSTSAPAPGGCWTFGRAPRARSASIMSSAMLSVARARMERPGCAMCNCARAIFMRCR